MTHDPRTALLRAALAAAERGWPVVPLRPRGKRPAGHCEERCPGTGRCADGHLVPEQRATLDPDLIRAAWEMRPYNVGIATGPAGLLVVDLDTLKPKDLKGTPDGATSFTALCERAGYAVPATYRTRTPSGGEHLYFTAPAGARLKSTAGRLARKVDTRAWGGYVVAPGSITPDGVYEALDDIPVMDLPAWLLKALTPASQRTAGPVRVSTPRNGSRCAQVALERESAAVAAAREGCREAELFRAARAMGRFVAWGDLDRSDVEQAFQAAGESAGLKPSECRSTLRSALNWSIRTARPRQAA
ncbi:bifunctional DNA primase/polymerase [Streptomyces sp. MUM 178J]|uniref:bifunctional DNA primase/polymerase n=1 Tax=Streptomyces sp. MUM 178J TaxID=2791991 RepID=UPI001F037D42|nr:bifunctional DNA primase/polymerase [Streptomyces sp. MUM 178J]WRQ83164.1 bifunctional DNA primase/polymerase [Streptomyces sp. MUM 178J]